MPRRKPYLLTPTARRHLREAKAWSLRRWGPVLTEEYFTAIHEAAQDLAKNHKRYRTREELAGGTGLKLFPVREHYLVYEPLAKNRIVIVAVIRQSRDIPDILAKGQHLISRELETLRSSVRRSE